MVVVRKGSTPQAKRQYATDHALKQSEGGNYSAKSLGGIAHLSTEKQSRANIWPNSAKPCTAAGPWKRRLLRVVQQRGTECTAMGAAELQQPAQGSLIHDDG